MEAVCELIHMSSWSSDFNVIFYVFSSLEATAWWRVSCESAALGSFFPVVEYLVVPGKKRGSEAAGEEAVSKGRVYYLLKPRHLGALSPWQWTQSHLHRQSPSINRNNIQRLEDVWGWFLWVLGFSFTTLLSHMLRMEGHIKNKHATYFEANYY